MTDFIANYWIEFAFGIVTAAIATGYKGLKKEMKARIEEQKAMKKAITALLRQTLYDAYSKWSERGYCPIYAMEVCTKVYEQYHALGGNNVGTELYERLRELPTKPKEEIDEHNEVFNKEETSKL